MEPALNVADVADKPRQKSWPHFSRDFAQMPRTLIDKQWGARYFFPLLLWLPATEEDQASWHRIFKNFQEVFQLASERPLSFWRKITSSVT
jgi:hypothetical protein